MWPFRKKHKAPAIPPLSLETKLALLASFGITLRPEFTIDDLLSSFDRSLYEEPCFDTVLVGLGMEHEESPYQRRSQNLWHFDTECIVEDGDYADIARRLMDMAGGSLPLTDIKDHVDPDKEEPWLSSNLDGETTRIDCKFNDDWLDPRVFGHFARLLDRRDPLKVFFYHTLGGGQDGILGCVTRENYTRLREHLPKAELLV